MQTTTSHTAFLTEQLEQSLLRSLAYFAVFQHPLSIGELCQFGTDQNAGQSPVQALLDNWVARGIIFRNGHWYQIYNDPGWVERRVAANRRADQVLPLATRIGRLIGSFPFVRSVFVSGSLSKHVMSEKSDVDFFIVTQPGRLWLARTLLILFKKVCLLNSHRYFCVNYFVDTENLEIAEKNLFTATEVVTLLPVYGREGYHTFATANAWARDFYPGFPPRPTESVPAQRQGMFKKTLEWVLGGTLGHWLDTKSMALTLGYWKRKFQHMDQETFALALKSEKGISKHHPLHFQQKVLDQYQINLHHLTTLLHPEQT
ncbi:MAG TPA: hypothetical protein VK168_01980 [Saprospiraceae bacterium]|nr:hypothetical protein [Saprospiraceae bacterium]